MSILLYNKEFVF